MTFNLVQFTKSVIILVRTHRENNQNKLNTIQ